MNSVLVIWQEIPESVAFVILSVDDADYEKLITFHNNFINNNATGDLGQEINDYFYDTDGAFKFTKETNPLFGHEFDLVVITGIVL